MATAPKMSNIGMALAGKTASVDIPKPRDTGLLVGRDNFSAVTSKGASQHQTMLPTPPNSISPTIPPQKFHRQPLPNSPSASSPHFDSDLDLPDTRDQPKPGQALKPEALDSLGDLDSAGAITPIMLAKYHLPDILLSHGPLAIRHVMSYLTTSVPGFSRVPPAKARRLVVSAFEGRGSGGEGGGLDGNVLFEKVGWGRWDARIRGQPPRERQASLASPPPSLPSSYSQVGVEIPGTSRRYGQERGFQYGTSLTANSAVFSHSEVDYEDHDIDMLEHEADKMSLDGRDEQGYCSSSEAPEDLLLDGDLGEGDVTDEEDWAGIGAAALRAKSFPTAAGGSRLYQPIAFHSKSYNQSTRSSGKPEQTALAQSVPHAAAGSVHAAGFSFLDGATGNSQERQAVEALLRLGSM